MGEKLKDEREVIGVEQKLCQVLEFEDVCERSVEIHNLGQMALRDSLNQRRRVRRIAEMALVEISLNRMAFSSSMTGSDSFSNSAGLPIAMPSWDTAFGLSFLLPGPFSGLSSGKEMPPFCPLLRVTRYDTLVKTIFHNTRTND